MGNTGREPPAEKGTLPLTRQAKKPLAAAGDKAKALVITGQGGLAAYQVNLPALGRSHSAQVLRHALAIALPAKRGGGEQAGNGSCFTLGSGFQRATAKNGAVRTGKGYEGTALLLHQGEYPAQPRLLWGRRATAGGHSSKKAGKFPAGGGSGVQTALAPVGDNGATAGSSP